MKRAIAALLTMLTLLCAAQGCGERLTVSVSSDMSTITLSDDDMFLNELRDMFDIEFEVIPTTSGESGLSDMYRLLAALDSLPDVFVCDANWDLNYFLRCGALTPLPDSLFEYPNLMSLITYPYARALQYDGKLWGFPSASYDSVSGMMDACVVFHRDIYENAWSYDEPPSTIDQWHELLANIKALYPDMIPLTSHNAQSMYNLTYFYSPATYTWVWDGALLRYIPGYYSDHFAHSIKALKPLWDDGLLDPDFMCANIGMPTGLDKFLLNRAAGIMYLSSPYAWQTEMIPQWKTTRPEQPIDENIQLVFMPADADGKYNEAYNYNITSVFFGTDAAGEKQQRILSMLDWLCSEDGRRMRMYGLEGVDYTVDAAGAITQISGIEQLCANYPSYTFFRTLPDSDTISLWQSMSADSTTGHVIDAYMEWRSLHGVNRGLLTNLRANASSSQAVLNFQPDVLSSAFRLLTSTDVDAEFELIKEEYRQNGIEAMIDSIYYSGWGL